jgi:hypothetical protein
MLFQAKLATQCFTFTHKVEALAKAGSASKSSFTAQAAIAAMQACESIFSLCHQGTLATLSFN